MRLRLVTICLSLSLLQFHSSPLVAAEIVSYSAPLNRITLSDSQMNILRRIGKLGPNTDSAMIQVASLIPQAYFIFADPFRRGSITESWRDPRLIKSDINYYEGFFDRNPGQGGEMIRPGPLLGFEDRPLAENYVVLVNRSAGRQIVIHEVIHLLQHTADKDRYIEARRGRGSSVNHRSIGEVSRRLRLNQEISETLLKESLDAVDGQVEFMMATLGHEVDVDHFVILNASYFGLTDIEARESAAYFNHNLRRLESRVDEAISFINLFKRHGLPKSRVAEENLTRYYDYKRSFDELREFLNSRFLP